MLRTAAAAGDDGIITRATTRSRTRSQSGRSRQHRDQHREAGEGTPTRIPRAGPGALTVPTTCPDPTDSYASRGRLRVVQRRDLQAGARPGDGRGEHRAHAGRPRRLTSQRAHRRGIGAGLVLVHARLTLPVNLDRSLALVCMFRGAHLPTTITRRGKRDTEVEICFGPRAGSGRRRRGA